MDIFHRLYNKALLWSRHRQAPKYLAAVSFAEASFFPVPVAVMLLPMALAQPSRAWRLAGLTLVFSVLGGVFGYLLGWGAYEFIEPLLHSHQTQMDNARNWFAEYGVWIVLMAGFSPVPYKIFTITAGALSMPLIPFILASVIGRASQFYLIAWLANKLGPTLEPKIRHYIEWLGWGSVVVITCIVVWLNIS